MDISFLDDALNGDHADVRDMNRFDLDSDGRITVEDCPFPPGSTEAKLWFKNILEPHIHASVTEEMLHTYGDKVVGAYKGLPLVPGEAGPGQGDFEFLVDKIHITQGVSYSAAIKIAGKVKALYYGG